MPEESAQKIAEQKRKNSEGGGLQKYKWWIVAGGGLVLVVLFMAVRSANKANSPSATTTNTVPNTGVGSSAINPSTGYLYGSPADLAAQGISTVGPTGAQGATGPPGPPGTPGAPGAPGAPGRSYPPIGNPVYTNPIYNPPPTPPFNQPAPVHKPIVHPPTSNTYTVRPGDNLTKIASQFKVNGGWQTLYSLNKHTIGGNPNLIHPGQVLKL